MTDRDSIDIGIGALAAEWQAREGETELDREHARRIMVLIAAVRDAADRLEELEIGGRARLYAKHGLTDPERDHVPGHD